MNATASSLPNTTLYFKDGSSDKVYQCEVKAQGTGFVVNFAYGRRGATLTTGTKTSSPVDLDKATKIFDKLIGEKTSKGYTPGQDGKPYTQTAHAGKRSSHVPQLLNMVDRAEAEALILDPSFAGQEKHDGQRGVIARTGTEVQTSNKKGLITSVLDEIRDAVLKLDGDVILDGELVGDHFFIFDFLGLPGTPDLKAQGFKTRYQAGLAYFKSQGIAPTPVGQAAKGTLVLVPAAFTTQEKSAMFKALEALGREGMVFKKTDASYVAGRPASGGNQRKFKFYETASCRVSGVNAQRSVSLEVLDSTTWTGVGNVTIPPNKAIPATGDVVEVRYLYAYKGGSLFQTTYLGKRNDVDVDECTADQLKYKAA